MQLTISFPDEIGHRLRTLPDAEAFITEVVAKALQHRVAEPSRPARSRSRWQRLVERIEADPVHLDGYSEQLKRDMREFRENFEFKHDRAS